MKTNNRKLDEQAQVPDTRSAEDPHQWKAALPPRTNGHGDRVDDVVWRPGTAVARDYQRAVSDWWWI